MNQFQYGIEVVLGNSSFLRPADLRRFDLLAIVNTDDQDISKVVIDRADYDSKINAELLRESILWAWTRKKDDFVYGDKSIEAIKKLSKVLMGKYEATEIPLVVNDIQEKIARIGFSIATFFHSTDKNHEKVILSPLHITLAGKLFQALYDHPNCRFDQYVKVIRSSSTLTDDEYKKIIQTFFTAGSNRQDVTATKQIFIAYQTGNDFNKDDLKNISGLSFSTTGDRIKLLRNHNLIKNNRGVCTKTTKMIKFLDRWDGN